MRSRTNAWSAVTLAFLILLTTAALSSGCKRDKKPAYDRSSPTKLMESFQLALSVGRIPRDTLDFFLAEREHISWKLRCKDRGCKSAQFKLDKIVREDAYAAEYMVQFAVFGSSNNRIMGGTQPIRITFSKSGNAWYFDEIGRTTSIQVGTPATDARDPPSASGDDAGRPGTALSPR